MNHKQLQRGQEMAVVPEKEPNQRYALLSVYDKSGIVELAKTLDGLGYRIISTGGTAKKLTEAGITVVPIQEVTGNPECFDGRMKTISFQVESGILYDRGNSGHQKEAQELAIRPIDIVVCNLYPFGETVAKPGVTLDEAVENIDVGGPTMVRAAAKNFKNVLVVVDPRDYDKVADVLRTGADNEEFRQALAAKAYNHLSFYDAQIAQFLSREQFPEEIALPGRKSIVLRYGENPHQKAVVYFEPGTNSPLAKLERRTGREMSYLNFTDAGSGIESVRMFPEPAAVVIKHNSPCGIALGGSSAEALERAVAADPESAFGGVVVLNHPLDMETARTFAAFKEENGVQIDIVAAPEITEEASDFIKGVRKSTGVYTFGAIPKRQSDKKHLRFFDGGFVAQDWDEYADDFFTDWRVAGEFKPTAEQFEQMKVAWKFISRIHSNTVMVIDENLPMSRGIGSGQTSRVRATKIALEQAGIHARGGILVSDSFFPFADSVELAVKAGIAAIVQQGGSVRDQDSIKAANEANIPMVLTGRRAFWH